MGAAVPAQPTLFDRARSPSIDAGALAGMRRVELGAGAWIEHLPSWVAGEAALMDTLVATTAWRSERRPMYDRIVDVPRLVANLPDDGPGHPVLEEIRALLSARYTTAFVRVGMGYYRDGADSVAWHGDTIARELPEAIVATVSLGEPRRFLLRPRDGGRSIAYRLGRGDLFVMGGTCQRTWRHAVPKVARALPRLAVMFRPIWDGAVGATPRRG
jgi:alkylated DNA repair dioxygenase AlkB